MTSRPLLTPCFRTWTLQGLVVICLTSLATPVFAQGSDPVGNVSALRGQADAIREDQSTEALAGNSSVFRKDILITRSASWLEIGLNDGSTFTLAENTRVEVSEFVPGDEPEGLLSLIRGRLRSTLSTTFSRRRDAYRVETKEGTMGVQGTEFDVLAAALHTDVYVYSGVVTVTHRNSAFPGTQLLYPGQMVTIRQNMPVPEPSSFLDPNASSIGSGGAQDIVSGGNQLDDPFVVDPDIPDIGDSGSIVPPTPNPPGL